jgi:hypothetical protein
MFSLLLFMVATSYAASSSSALLFPCLWYLLPMMKVVLMVAAYDASILFELSICYFSEIHTAYDASILFEPSICHFF